MKQKLFLPLVAIIVCSFITEPYLYYFSTVDPETGRTGRKLERTTAVYQKPKGKATTTDYIISGSKSSARIRIIEAIFEAHADEATTLLEPTLYIALYKLNSGKNNRVLSMTPDGGGAMLIPVTITRLDPYIFRIMPGVAMQPGEYAMVDRTMTTSDGNLSVSTFGID
jgi:hypothetical protein